MRNLPLVQMAQTLDDTRQVKHHILEKSVREIGWMEARGRGPSRCGVVGITVDHLEVEFLKALKDLFGPPKS